MCNRLQGKDTARLSPFSFAAEATPLVHACLLRLGLYGSRAVSILAASAMPITLQISPPDRMVIGILRGAVTAEDLDGFVADIAAAKALRYRKIIDVMGASGLTPEGLAAFRDRIRGMALPPNERGPIALVADREIAGLARMFAQLMGDERPVEVFASIHAARRWLDANS